MKLLFLLIILIVIIIYTNKNNNEKFGNNEFNKTNQFDVLNTAIVKPVMTTDENRLKYKINPERAIYNLNYDSNKEDIYAEKYWTIKKEGFSDMYNYHDIGGLEVLINSNNVNCSLNDRCETFTEIKQKKDSENVITFKGDDYELLGAAINPYYNQYFYLYENEVNPPETRVLRDRLNYMDNHLFQYLLVKKEDNNLIVSHEIGPRTKINLNDVVYFSFATFQLGPLNIKNI
jgi:hypothetical protein